MDELAKIDRVANATQLWLTLQNNISRSEDQMPMSREERDSLANGFITGLAPMIRLDTSDIGLVAYALVMINGDYRDVLEKSKKLLKAKKQPFYQRGLMAALKLREAQNDETQIGESRAPKQWRTKE